MPEENLMKNYSASRSSTPIILQQPRAVRDATLPWRFATAAFAISTLILFLKSLELSENALYKVFPTDLGVLQSVIRLEQKVFNGALLYNGTGQLIIETPGDKDVWVGTPTPEMDRLWDQLESASTVLLEGEEANSVRDKTTLIRGYWKAGLDVMHQLHCLNMIRKQLYPGYYIPKEESDVKTMHWEHCLNYIRQAIMCNADISPVTETWYESAELWAPDFKTMHTCKNFPAIMEWALERSPKARANRPPGKEVATDETLDMSGEQLRLHNEHTKGTSHHSH